MKSQTPRVALLIETSRGYGRSMLRGIMHYARQHGPWQFYLTPGDLEQALPQMKHWGGTGIIARIETQEVADAIVASGLPAIGLDISQNVPIDLPSDSRVSEVASDSYAAAVIAAEHLLERGLRCFAYVGDASRQWSRQREEGFCKRITAAGYIPFIYKLPEGTREQRWEMDQTHLSKWIASLPKPVGIMACNDDRGRQVLDACSSANIMVPLEAAVVGVDNDDLLCELASPPLSSVALNAEAGGYRAAALLDKMMKGRVRKPTRLIVEPLYVVQRRSTDPSVVDDPDVAAALQFIQAHSAEQIKIDDIVSQLNVSRRMFEIKFRKTVGRSPHQELRHTRLLHSQRLLVETDMPIADIAVEAGFCSAAHLVNVFQQDLQMTPAQYRRLHTT